MNNIFNPYEFNVKGDTGTIVEPSKECKCFYLGTCVDGVSCMETLEPTKVFESVNNIVESI